MHAGQRYEMQVAAKAGDYSVVLQGKTVSARVLAANEALLEIDVDGIAHRVIWARHGRKMWLHLDGRSYELEKPPTRAAAIAGSGGNSLRAPMPGQVRKVLVRAGEQVQAGAVLMMLEAMKMEIRIQAPADAKVTQVTVKEGQSIEKDQLLVELEA
jgi:acetyl/propionyl-CoA carboxylase alpha subunit